MHSLQTYPLNIISCILGNTTHNCRPECTAHISCHCQKCKHGRTSRRYLSRTDAYSSGPHYSYRKPHTMQPTSPSRGISDKDAVI